MQWKGLGFNATFNNILVISWQSVLLLEEIRAPGENHRPVASHWQTLSHRRHEKESNENNIILLVG